MRYPTLKQIEAAGHYRLAYWFRFLPSPGWMAADTDDFENTMVQEEILLERINERLQMYGGITTAISKAIGLEKPNEG